MCLICIVARKAKSASKSALTKFKKAVGIPTGVLSEANPRYYLVLHPHGALVRDTINLDSREVYNLKQGDVVTCAEIIGRRARLIDPVEGWVSLVSVSNETIMELTFPPDKRTQQRTMARRFDKLKEQQKSDDTSPIATPMVHRSEDAVVANIKAKIVFKSSQPEQPVPKLSFPVVSPKVDDLLDFNSSNISTPQKFDDPFSLI